MMTFSIAFPIGTFKTLRQAFDFVAPFLRFEIARLKIGAEPYDDFDTKALIALNTPTGPNLTLWGTDDREVLDHYLLFRTDLRSGTDVYIAAQFDDDQIAFEELNIAAVAHQAGMGIQYDGDKAFWQSAFLVNTYEAKSKPHFHLPKKLVLTLPKPMQEQIDIFQNPGHRVLTAGTFLMAAPKMWFGPAVLKYFNSESLLSFPKKIAARQILPELINVHLFDENVDDYESPEILTLQAEFRQWTGMNEIETRLNARLEQ